MPGRGAWPFAEEDLAWAAGFLEGEGTFGYYSSQTLTARACQKDLWPLQELQRIFGGSIYPPNGRATSTWATSGTQALRVMEAIRPRLSPRRQTQIDKAIKARGEPKHNRDKTHCKQGHSFSGDNLRIVRSGNGHTRRVCVTCHDGWMKKHRERVAA